MDNIINEIDNYDRVLLNRSTIMNYTQNLVSLQMRINDILYRISRDFKTKGDSSIISNLSLKFSELAGYRKLNKREAETRKVFNKIIAQESISNLSRWIILSDFFGIYDVYDKNITDLEAKLENVIATGCVTPVKSLIRLIKFMNASIDSRLLESKEMIKLLEKLEIKGIDIAVSNDGQVDSAIHL